MISGPFFPHQLVRGYNNRFGSVVDSVNGVKIRSLAHLVALLSAGDWVALRRTAHSLKGSSVSMGAPRLGERAAQIEKLAATGESSDALRDAVAGVEVCQHLHRIVQLTAAYFEQLLKHQAANIQLLARLAAYCGAGSGLYRDIERADHHQEQQHQHPGDARLKTIAQHHGLS